MNRFQLGTIQILDFSLIFMCALNSVKKTKKCQFYLPFLYCVGMKNLIYGFKIKIYIKKKICGISHFFPLRSVTFLNVNFPVVFHLSANCTHSKFIYYIIYLSMPLVHTHAHSLVYTKDEYVYAHTFFSFVLYPFISLPSLPVYAVSLECCLCIIYVSLCSAIKMVRSF